MTCRGYFYLHVRDAPTGGMILRAFPRYGDSTPQKQPALKVAFCILSFLRSTQNTDQEFHSWLNDHPITNCGKVIDIYTKCKVKRREVRASECRVPKLFRQKVSPKRMVKLTDRKIKWAVKQVIKKGESTAVVAAIYGISRRMIQQLVREEL